MHTKDTLVDAAGPGLRLVWAVTAGLAEAAASAKK